MKKKMMLLMMVAVMAAAVFAGCGSKGNEQTVSGTFRDKKDFLFTIEDEAGVFYGFNFEEKPEGYDELNNGDQVKVTYEGTLSEVDPFVGEIIKIEKRD